MTLAMVIAMTVGGIAVIVLASGSVLLMMIGESDLGAFTLVVAAVILYILCMAAFDVRVPPVEQDKPPTQGKEL